MSRFQPVLAATAVALLSCLVLLETATAQTLAAGTYNLPEDGQISNSQSIGSDTTLNIFDEGSVGLSFSAGVRIPPTGPGTFSTVSENVFVNVFGGQILSQMQAYGSVINVTGGSIGDRFTANVDSDVTISGGEIGNFFTNNSITTVNGGQVGRNFETVFNAETTISGGVIGSNLTAERGSIVKIDGGKILSNFTAESGSDVSIAGGSFARRLNWNTGANVDLVGGEFRLNGQRVTDSTVSLSQGDVLAGSFQSGETFIFSNLLGDVVATPVNLINAALPAPMIGAQTVSDASTLTSLRAGESLQVVDGGQLGSDFAAVGGTLTVDGGTVGRDMEASGATVNVSDGLVSFGFIAFDNTVVNQSGGSMDSYTLYSSDSNITEGTARFISANSQSVVNISGGQVESLFARSDSQVEISGGNVDSISASGDSEVSISGGTLGDSFENSGVTTLTGNEFLINGEAIVGSAVTLGARDILSGTLQDGSVIIVSPLDGFQSGVVNLNEVALPSSGQNFVIDDSVVAPNGLRMGQSLTLQEGGVIRNNFSAVSSMVVIDAGTVRANAEFFDSDVAIAGGSLDSVEAFANTELSITGGSFDEISAFDAADVDISGGQTRLLSAQSGGSVEIFGGEIDQLLAFDESMVNIFGNNFQIDGVDVEFDALGQTLLVGERNGEALTGTFVDGTQFSFELFSFGLNASGFESTDFVEQNAALFITNAAAVPEPSGLIIIMLCGTCTPHLRQRRRRL